MRPWSPNWRWVLLRLPVSLSGCTRSTIPISTPTWRPSLVVPVLATLVARRRAVDAQQPGRLEAMGGFFPCLANDAFQQGFAIFQVSGRLVEADAVAGLFFHQQEFSVALNDGGDGDVGFPDHDATCVNKG